jgi:hypothetical protein
MYAWQCPLSSAVHRDVIKACASTTVAAKLPSDPAKYRAWRDDLHALLSLVHFLDRDFWILVDDYFDYVCCTIHSSFNRMIYDILALRLTAENSSYLKSVAPGDGIQVYVNIATDMIGNSTQTYRLYNCLKDIIGMKGGVAANSIAEFNVAEATLLASLEEFQLTTGVLLPDTVAATLLCNKLHPQFDAAIYPLLVSTTTPLTLRALRGVVAASLHFKAVGNRSARPPVQPPPRSSSNHLSSSVLSASKGGLTCHRCGKPGHTTTECDKPSTVNCRHCLKSGHLIEACMKKKQGLPAVSEHSSGKSSLKSANAITIVEPQDTALHLIEDSVMQFAELDASRWGDEAIMNAHSLTLVPTSCFCHTDPAYIAATPAACHGCKVRPCLQCYELQSNNHRYQQLQDDPLEVQTQDRVIFSTGSVNSASVCHVTTGSIVQATLDTGAEVHCTGDVRFKKYCRELTNVAVATATGEIVRSCGSGTVMLFTECGHGIILKDLQYVEGLKKTLIAPKLLVKQNIYLNCLRNKYELSFPDDSSVRLSSSFGIELFLPRVPDVCPIPVVLTPRLFELNSRVKVHYTYFAGELAPSDNYFHGVVEDLKDMDTTGCYRYKVRFDDNVTRTIREVDLMPSNAPLVRAKGKISATSKKSGRKLPNKIRTSSRHTTEIPQLPTKQNVNKDTSIEKGTTPKVPVPTAEVAGKTASLNTNDSYLTLSPYPVVRPSGGSTGINEPNSTEPSPPATKLNRIDQLHLQFNHASEEVLKHLGKWNNKYKIPPNSVLSPCEYCLKAKATIKSAGKFLSKRNDCLQVFDMVHSDSGGKIEPMSLQGSSYYHIFVDSFSSYIWINSFSSAPTSNHLQHGLNMLRTELGIYPRALHSDNGSDYTAAATAVFCTERGIKQSFATPYHHDENGTAERAQRTIWTAARTALTAANAPDNLWEYALRHSIFVKNVTPMRRLKWLTPYEIVYGVKPLDKIEALHPFGCTVYFHLHENNPRHLDTRATKGIFLGIASNSSAHTFIIGHHYHDGFRDGLQIIRTTDVTFLDNIPFFDSTKTTTTTGKVDNQTEETLDEIRYANSLDTYCDPKSSKEAASRPPHEAAEWKRGEDKEWLENVLVNACEIVDISEAEGHKIIPTHCVYKLKPAVPSLNKPPQYKVRVVVRGNLEDPSNIGSVFAPTVPIMVFRMLIAIFQSKPFRRDRTDLVIRAGDVSNAFCLAPMPADKVVFIYPPLPRYRIPGKIFRLKSALYGLAESPRLWYEVFNKLLQKFGFIQSENEPCLFYTLCDDQLADILIIFVDDCLYTGSLSVWNKIVAHLQESIPFKDLGRPDKFLGLNLSYSDAGITISHEDYVAKILTKFDFHTLNPTKTPMDVNLYLEKLPERVPDPSYYQQLVGSLIHTASYYNVALCYPLKELSRHLLAHSKPHFDAVKRVYRYLKGSQSLGLFAANNGSLNIVTYVDANWAPKSDNRRSTSGLLQLIDSLPTAFSSKEQKSIALSTCEAELFAISQAVRLIGYQRALLMELKLISDAYCFIIYSDSRSAIDLIANTTAQIPAKHIDIRLKHIREQVSRGVVQVIHVPSADNLADICTKPLPIDAFTTICSRIFRSRPDVGGC